MLMRFFVDYYEFWLKSIDRYSDESTPVIVVGTHADKIEETVIMYLRRPTLIFIVHVFVHFSILQFSDISHELFSILFKKVNTMNKIQIQNIKIF